MDGNAVHMYETLSMNAGDCVVCMFCLYAYAHIHVCVSTYMYNTCVLAYITCMAVCTRLCIVYLCIRVV